MRSESTRQVGRWIMVVGAVLFVVALAGRGERADAQLAGWGLTSFCTPAESYPAFRTFRVRNSTGVTTDVVLRNQSINQQITVTATPGDTFWLVPARSGGNTVILLVGGVQAGVKASNNAVCATLAGNALCNPTTGVTTVTWTMRNNDTGPASITDGGGQTFAPNPVPAAGNSIATQTLPASATNSTLSLTVVVDLGQGVFTRPSATINVGACVPPPVTSFTFTKTPSVTTAEVGATVTYTYAGTNTGTTQLEVLGLVDDRLGIVIEAGPTPTIVEPGASLSRTVTYVVKPEDASTTILNNAVVVVRPIVNGVAQDPQTAVASASVVAPEEAIVDPPVPPTTTPPPTAPSTTVPTTVAPGTLPATGSDTNWLLAALAAALVAVGASLVAARRT